MAIVRQTVASGGDAVVDTSHTFNAPSGIAAGDVIVAHISWNGTPGTITKPSGWVDIGNNAAQSNPKCYAYYLIAGASEPSTYVWTTSSSVYSGGVLVRYSGVDTTTPLDVAAGSASAATEADQVIDLPSITTVTANAMVIGGATSNSSADRLNYTAGGIFSEAGRSFGTSIKNGLVVDGIQASAGATGTIPVAINSASIAWAGLTIALRPASGGSPQTLTIPHLDASGALYAPTVFVDQAVALGLLTSTSALYAPTLVQTPGTPVWTTPLNTAVMGTTPTLTFTTPVVTSGALHFQIEIDDDPGFGSPIVYDSHLDQTGWEYDHAPFVALPASGMPSPYTGNDARYTVQTPLANGTWYRRVRVGAYG